MDMHPQDVETSAHVAGYFCLLSPWKAVPVASIATLAYLADRLDCVEHGHPIGRGPWTLTERGPVVARTAALAEGAVHHPQWGRLLESGGGLLRVRAGFAFDTFDMLSRNSEKMIRNTWERFGGMSPDELGAWSLDPANLPEIAATNDGDISVYAMMLGGGFPEEQARDCAEHHQDMEGVTDLFRRMG